jgi:hypothetical protein
MHSIMVRSASGPYRPLINVSVGPVRRTGRMRSLSELLESYFGQHFIEQVASMNLFMSVLDIEEDNSITIII